MGWVTARVGWSAVPAASEPAPAPRAATIDRRMLTYLAGFTVVGVSLSVGGPALSYLRARAHTDHAGIATVFVAQSLGYIVGALAGGRLLDGGRGHRAWLAAMAGSLSALAIVAASRSLWAMGVGFTLVGVFGALADVCGNTLTVWRSTGYAGRRLNALHLAFAIGAVTSPVVVDRSLAWTGGLWLVLVPVALVIALVGPSFLRTPAPARPRIDATATPGGQPRRWALGLVCGYFFLYVALEVTFAGWIHSYVEDVSGGSTATATAVTMVFWIGFTVGRLGAIWLAGRVTAGVLVGAATVASVVASALFVAVDGTGPMLWVVTALFAVSVAPQYASMVAHAESRLGLRGRDTSLIIATSGLGGLVMPWVVGILFDRIGPYSLPRVVLAVSVAAGLVLAVTNRALGAGRAGQRPPLTSSTAPVT